jgi:hypothetical protein
MKIIKYNKKQNEYIDESLIKYTHVICGPTDYTLCGHATDEYDYEIKKSKKVTCPWCISIIKECKEIKL